MTSPDFPLRHPEAGLTQPGGKTYADIEGIDPRSVDYPLRHPPEGDGHGHGDGGGGSGDTDLEDGDYTQDELTRFIGLPGKPEIWKNTDTGGMYAVYYVPGVEPPIPLLMTIPTEKVLKTYFGNQDVEFDREYTSAEIDSYGAISFGDVGDIEDNEGDPWAGFVQKMDRAREVMPWLEDPEVFSIIGGAYLEGRPVEDWELAGTEWYQIHNEAERTWMTQLAQDPASAAQFLNGTRITVSDFFLNAGAELPDAAVIDYIALQYASGKWSEGQTKEQISVFTGGGEGSTLNEDFDAFLNEGGYASTVNATVGIDQVRDMFHTWLGPLYTPDDSVISEWAGRFRDDPEGAQGRLTEHLRSQRLALFPSYADANLTYQDIAAPWKAMAQNAWGVPADDMDSELHAIINMNNATEAQKELRRIGATRGYDRTIAEMAQGIDQGMSRGVRGAV